MCIQRKRSIISCALPKDIKSPGTTLPANWTFCGSPEGANASACVYSLVETAKVNGSNPYKYLEYILSILPGSDFQTNSKILALMMPWDELIKKTCKF